MYQFMDTPNQNLFVTWQRHHYGVCFDVPGLHFYDNDDKSDNYVQTTPSYYLLNENNLK